MATTVATGRKYTGPKVSSTRVVSGGPVAVKSTGQTLSSGGGSARTPTPSPTHAPTPSTPTTQQPTPPRTISGQYDVLAMQIAQAKGIQQPGPTVAKATVMQPSTIQPTTIRTGTSGGVARTNYGGVDYLQTQVQQTQALQQPGPTTAKATLPPPTKTITLRSQPSAYKYTPGILPSAYAADEYSIRRDLTIAQRRTEEVRSIAPTTITKEGIDTTQLYLPPVITGSGQIPRIAPSWYAEQGLDPNQSKYLLKKDTSSSKAFDKLAEQGGKILTPIMEAKNKIESIYSKYLLKTYENAMKNNELLFITPGGTPMINPKAIAVIGPTETKEKRLAALNYLKGQVEQKTGMNISSGFTPEVYEQGSKFQSDVALTVMPLQGAKKLATMGVTYLAKNVPKVSKFIEGFETVDTAITTVPGVRGFLARMPYYATTQTAKGLVVFETYKATAEPVVLTKEAKQLMNTPDVLSAYSESKVATSQSVGQDTSIRGYVRSFGYSILPGLTEDIFVSAEGKTAAKQAFETSLSSKGYTKEQIGQAWEIAKTETKIRAGAEAASILSIEAGSEGWGRKGVTVTFQRAGKAGVTGGVSTINKLMGKTSISYGLPLTASEGFSQSIVSQRSQEQRINFAEAGKVAAVSGALGTPTFFVVGRSAITKDFGGRATNVIANIADPWENPGDVTQDWLGDVYTSATGKRLLEPSVYVSGSKVYSFAPTTSVTTNVQKDVTPKSFNAGMISSVGTASTAKSSNKPTTPIKQISNAGWGKGRVKSFSPISSKTNGKSQTPISFPSQFPSNVPSEIPSEVPSEVPSEIPSYVPSNVPSNVPSEVPTQINIPIVTAPGLPFGLGAGWAGGDFGGGKRKRRGLGYVPSFAAVYLGIKGKAPRPVGGAYSGLEFRPIIGSVPRVRRGKKVKFKYTKKKASKGYGLGKVMAAI